MSLLGPLLFSLFTSDLPNNVPSGNTHLYANDATLYFVARTADQGVRQHNRALSEINARLPSKKYEAMLLHERDFTGPLQQLRNGKGFAKWDKYTRLLGVTLDDKFSWAKHLKDLQRTYAIKLALLVE